jgi:hypothetical protein
MPGHDCLASIKKGVKGCQPHLYPILDIPWQLVSVTGLLEQFIQSIRYAFNPVDPCLSHI